MELASLIEFDSICCRAQGLSPNSIALTTQALRRLEQFLQQNNLPTRIDGIGPGTIRAFIIHLQTSHRFAGHPYAGRQETHLSSQTVNAYMRSIRAAWNRWTKEGLVEQSPFAVVKVPRAAKTVTQPLTDHQVVAILEAIDTSTPEGFRDLALINLYLDTTCRLSELTGVTMADLDFDGRSVKVLGKGGRERIVPFGNRAAKLLWKYINVHRPDPASPDGDFLFLTGKGRRLSKGRVEAIVKNLARKAGITGVRVYPHLLRHTACVLWVRNRGDLFSLQRLTGHSSLKTLAGYVNLAQSDVAAAHRLYSPVDNLPSPSKKRKKGK